MANFQIADELSFISRLHEYQRIATFATGRFSRPASLSSGRHVANRAVQPHAIIIVDEPGDESASLIERQRHTGSQAIARLRAVPMFGFAVNKFEIACKQLISL